MWGIQPQKAGFSQVQIKPQMGKLENCSISYPTILGQIKGEFKKISPSQTAYTIELPANMVGEFIIDLSSTEKLMPNGEQVPAAFGSVRLYPGVNTLSIESK